MCHAVDDGARQFYDTPLNLLQERNIYWCLRYLFLFVNEERKRTPVFIGSPP
jgi:hypothetical protein